ncbi:MAG: hypothetical protein BGN88_13575 [Clostridiales bacterium 43-6]|nr:MAG: hypothetical protein BGN88_13575 [Clostridiales bacterium 43-6]
MSFRETSKTYLNEIVMIDEIKKLLIERYCLTKVIHTKHNNIYEGEGLVLIESTLTGMLKLKPKRR